MLLRASYQREIDKFCQTIVGGEFNVREITKGALTQARAKLNPWAFKRLSEVALNTFYKEAEYTVWQNYRILAVDGSRLKLPYSVDISKVFGEYKVGPKANSRVIMASCSLLYDVLNHTVVDSQIGPWSKSEKDFLFEDHLSKITKEDLIIADRYYPSYELMLRLEQRGAAYCLRMKENWWIGVKEFVKSGEEERIVEFEIPEELKERLKLAKSKKVIRCRLIRIELEKGIEILCTSLTDKRKYPIDQFGAMYELRWGIEEGFKLLKSRMELEAFTGKTAQSIEQDFYAKVFMLNLCATLAYPIEEKIKEECAKEKTGNKFDQKMNRTYAVSLLKDNIVNIFYKKTWQQIIDLIDKIIFITRDIIRPFRKNPRRIKVPKQYHPNYKPI